MILAMNFDFSWFLTIPGMLITGGVLLLIIALIIFIATSSKKGKGKNRNEEMNQVSQAGAQAILDSAQSVAMPPMTDGAPMAVPEMAFNDMQMGGVPSMEMSQGMTMPNIDQSAMATPSMPSTPIDNSSVSTVPEIAPVEMASPVVEAPTIYGGASPVVPNINIDNQPHQIYGGANPMDNTQTLPVMEPESISTSTVTDPIQPAPIESMMTMQPDMMSTEPVVPVQSEPFSMEQAMSIQPEIAPVEVAMPVQPEVVPVEPIMTPQPEAVPVTPVTMTQPDIVTPVANVVEQPEVLPMDQVIMAQPEVVPMSPIMPVEPVAPVIENVSSQSEMVSPTVAQVAIPQVETVAPQVVPPVVDNLGTQPVQQNTAATTTAPVEVVEIA